MTTSPLDFLESWSCSCTNSVQSRGKRHSRVSEKILPTQQTGCLRYPDLSSLMIQQRFWETLGSLAPQKNNLCYVMLMKSCPFMSLCPLVLHIRLCSSQALAIPDWSFRISHQRSEILQVVGSTRVKYLGRCPRYLMPSSSQRIVYNFLQAVNHDTQTRTGICLIRAIIGRSWRRHPAS